MALQKRKSLVDIFSTFLKLGDNREDSQGEWIVYTPLKNSMESQIQKDPKGHEDYWALFWLQEVLKNPKLSVARGHLSAYLEEVCYWITVKDIQQILEIYRLTKADGFQIVRAIAATPEIWKNYQSECGRIKNYGRKCISQKAKEEIRQGREEERFSKAGRLRYITKTRLTESLKQAGIQEPKFYEWLLAWQCFQEIYTVKATKGCQTLDWPSPENLAEIAEYYNQQRTPIIKAIDSKKLDDMLDQCQRIIREYSSKKLFHTDSIEELEEKAEKENQEKEEPQGQSEKSDSLEVPTDIYNRSDILEPSDFQLQQEVNSILSKAFEKLKSEDLKILQLYAGLKMTQAEISQILNISQSQVSRKISSSKATLLKALAKWIIKKPNNILLSSEQLNRMSPELEEWLDLHCTIGFNECLKTALIQSFAPEISLLTQLYVKRLNGKRLKPQVIAETLKISESELQQKVEKIKQNLHERLLVHLEKRLKVSLKPCPSANRKMSIFIKTWLENAPYATFR